MDHGFLIVIDDVGWLLASCTLRMAALWNLLAYSVGGLIASPQIMRTLHYYPKSIRSKTTSSDKQRIGSIPAFRLFKSMFLPGLRDQADGVFYPEATLYIGIVGVVAAFFSHSWHHWLLWVVSFLMAMGRRTPLFGWLSPLMMRVPARWCYFASLSLAFMAVSGLSQLTDYRLMNVLILIQSLDLCLNTSSLWPMEPYTQRWERPSRVFSKPYLSLFQEPWRVSGLPFPMRTGYVNHIRTLGYTGGGQLTAMAGFRHDENPDGSGLHDWFQSENSQGEANWFGVRWAITQRPLLFPWKPTPFSHVYENNSVSKNVPSWKDLEDQCGPGSIH